MPFEMSGPAVCATAKPPRKRHSGTSFGHQISSTTSCPDGKASARHRIEAAKEIRQVAIGGNDAESPTGAAERFVITFNLGADVERIEKTITPRPILPANEEDTRDAE